MLEVFWALSYLIVVRLSFVILQEEPKEESDDDMGFSLFD